jgi:peptide methionine sulfoxide reductase msrA/msrB
MALTNPAAGEDPLQRSESKRKDSKSQEKLEQVTFGSGCFWCTEAVFAELDGVHSAVSGYSGGRVPHPTYEQVSTGLTGHAECIQVTYDPAVISFPELLEVFWKTHDPTTLNQQGPDHGTQYRSAIFYHNDDQRREAEQYKQKLDASGAFDAPIVTEITPFDKFYPAEDYHQDFYKLNPRQSYCRAVIRPKVEKFRKVFKDKLKVANPKHAPVGRDAAERSEDQANVDTKRIDWSKVNWRKKLDRNTYHITREAGTERPFSGKYWDLFEDGQYRCSNCGLPLFESVTKFDAGCGWPSFDKTVAKDSVVELADNTLGMQRVEVRCRRCGAHLGHVFDDGPTATGLRYCMNSASLKFIPADEAVEEDDASAAKEKPKNAPK